MCTGSRDMEVDGSDPIIEVITDQPRKRCICVVPIRYVLVFLGMLGCMLEYLMRFGLSVAIIAMVNETHSANHSTTSTHACPAALNISSDQSTSGAGEFSWSVEDQGIILGTFFWGYFFTKTIGGRISEVFGSRETMALSVGVSSLLCMLTPTFAAIHPLALAALRFVMGMMQGPSLPALFSLVIRWAPQDKVATLASITFSGMSLGSVVAMGTSHWVVDYMGWRWVFWNAGIAGLVWTPLWLYFVRNSPSNHPHMSRQEEELLAPNLVIQPKRRVPWSRMVKCWRFYPCILLEFATTFISNFTTNQGPTFLNTQVGLSMNVESYVLTAGQVSCVICSMLYGLLSDWLLKTVQLKKVNVRRFLHCIGVLLIEVGLVSIMVAGCNKWVVSGMIIAIMVGTTAMICSFSLTAMDIAPNYAGTLSGLVGIGDIGGFLAPVITADVITKSGGWKAAIAMDGSIFFVASVVYIAFTTAEIQEWNDYEELPSSKDGE